MIEIKTKDNIDYQIDISGLKDYSGKEIIIIIWRMPQKKGYKKYWNKVGIQRTFGWIWETLYSVSFSSFFKDLDFRRAILFAVFEFSHSSRSEYMDYTNPNIKRP